MVTYKEFSYSDYFKTELPTHWQEKRLGFLSMQTKNAFVDGPFGSDLKSDDYLDEGVPLIQLNNIRDGKHILRNMKFISDNKKKDLVRHLALPQDIVIAKMADPVARAAIVSDEFKEYVIVADCVKLTPNLKLVDLNFLIWAINSDCVRENAELVSTGTTRIRINLGELKKLKVPYPSLSEQIQIRTFLDYETAKIDSLIEKQQQLIQLLKEKRQAVISHAVTKGLNSDVPMKDSGVEWLGQVPEDWEVSKIQYYAKIESGHTPSKSIEKYWENCTIPWISLNDSKQLRVVDYISDTAFEISELGLANSSARILPKNTVVFTRDASIGLSAITTKEMAVSQHLIAWLPKTEKLCPEFLLLIFYAMEKEFDRYTFGSTIKTIGMDNIRSLTATFPSLIEQKKIVDWCFNQFKTIDKSIAKSNALLTILRERRTALISAAVTGKIDVRNWQNPTEAKMEFSA